MAFVGKRYKAASEKIDKLHRYSLKEAIGLIKQTATSKFDETVDIVIALGVDVKQSDQMVRGVVALPHGTGKTARVAVFARDAKADEAKAAGADIVGADDLVDDILKGVINFDRCIATPDMMGLVGRVAKVLGPKGLMPNPKLGTVTMNVGQAVSLAKAGQVEFRAEKAGLVHAGLGKVSFSESDLEENIKTFIDAIVKAKPAGAKGVYMKSIGLSSTMGVGVKIDISTVEA